MSGQDLLQPLAAEMSAEAPRVTGRSALLAMLVGGIYSLGCVPIALTVLTRKKIVEDPTGPSAEMVSVCQTLFWVGWAGASVFATPLMDRYGRRRPMYALVALGLAATLTKALATTDWLFGTALFMIGCTFPVAGQMAYVLMQESLPERLQATAMVALNTAWASMSVVQAVVGGTLALDLNWRVETLLWHMPYALLLLVGCLVVEESPQFLRTKAAGGHPEAQGFLKPCRLLLTSPLPGRLTIIMFCWSAYSVSYYGLNYFSGSLSPNTFTNFALLSAMDIVGSLMSEPLVNPLGAKRTQVLAYAGIGCSLLTCALLPADTWQLVPAMLGRLFANVSCVTIYLLFIDCFPTECRGTANGIANCLVRLITLVTPLFDLLPLSLVCLFLAMFCLAGCPATWLLPDKHTDATAKLVFAEVSAVNWMPPELSGA